MNPPSAEEWGEVEWDLDLKDAFRRLAGKTEEEAVPLFGEGDPVSELQLAPDTVFNYYIFSYVRYVLSAERAGHPDAASSFLSLVSDRASRDAVGLNAVWARLNPFLRQVAGQQEFYDADPEIYGSFLERCAQIEAAMQHPNLGGV
jgi:hypothetical protein